MALCKRNKKRCDGEVGQRDINDYMQIGYGFPLGFFNSTQHLRVHLSYKVKGDDHVQYRWMHHI